jgi:hypothetical protein
VDVSRQVCYALRTQNTGFVIPGVIAMLAVLIKILALELLFVSHNSANSLRLIVFTLLFLLCLLLLLVGLSKRASKVGLLLLISNRFL